MSRIDDDREESLAAARLAEARRAAENQKARKVVEGDQFSKLVGQQKTQGQLAQQSSAAKSAIAQLLESAGKQKAEKAKDDVEHVHEGHAQSQTQETTSKDRQGVKSSTEKTAQSGKTDAAASQKGKVSERGTQARGADAQVATRTSAGRASSSKSDDQLSSHRKESLEEHAGTGAGASEGAGGKGELKADADQGGGGASSGGGKDKDQGNPGAAAANFRFNPALMAPPGIARPKETTGSERLRKVANELAQKIVEKVRVGTNAAGKMEFQVDLRSDVLSGLSVKVSAQNGKIRAVFSGKDRDVLKMIQEQGDSLKRALAARGLTLEEFKIEART